jgi:hypothetical protein
LINVLGLLVDLEPEQAALLDRVCGGPLITLSALKSAGAFGHAGPTRGFGVAEPHQAALFGDMV